MISFLVIFYFLAATASATLVGVPHVTTTQHHSQDGLGQYSYGYSGGPSAKEETRTADGVTRGSFSYIDANGILQSASYVSDPINGFRITATNLPQAPASVPIAPAVVVAVPAVPVPPTGFDPIHGVPLETPEVAAAKAAHFAAHGEALARLARRWRRSLVPTSGSYSYSTPSGSTTVVASPNGRSFSYSTVASAPTIPVSVPVARSFSPPSAATIPLTSRYQSHDGFGQYSYGYSDGLSSKTEFRSADGVTQGGYSYLDSNGIVQNVKYVADANGFRVHATNLPVAPTA